MCVSPLALNNSAVGCDDSQLTLAQCICIQGVRKLRQSAHTGNRASARGADCITGESCTKLAKLTSLVWHGHLQNRTRHRRVPVVLSSLGFVLDTAGNMSRDCRLRHANECDHPVIAPSSRSPYTPSTFGLVCRKSRRPLELQA